MNYVILIQCHFIPKTFRNVNRKGETRSKGSFVSQTLTQFTNFDTKQIGNACFHIALDADLVYVFQKVKLSLVLNIKQVYRYNYAII